MDNIQERIRYLRELAELSKSAVANALGKSAAAYGKKESGETRFSKSDSSLMCVSIISFTDFGLPPRSGSGVGFTSGFGSTVAVGFVSAVAPGVLAGVEVIGLVGSCFAVTAEAGLEFFSILFVASDIALRPAFFVKMPLSLAVNNGNKIRIYQ